MELQDQFNIAVEQSKKLNEKPSNDILLKIYSLFKQASEGDNSGVRPTGFDFVAMAKFDAWESQKGKSKESAMQEYIELINSLK